jgi:multidrug efflux pump subunit AcrB
MNRSELSIRRPTTTTLTMLGICVFGVMSYQLLPNASALASGARAADGGGHL